MKKTGQALAGFFSLTFASALVAYCLIFPVWIYGVLYDRTSAGPGFFRYGLFAPFRDFPISSFATVIIVLALSLCVIVVPRLSSFFSLRCVLLGAVSLAVSIASCLAVYIFAHDVYKDAIAIKGLVLNELAARQSIRAELMQRGEVPDVAYYRFLDKERVSSLYTQIEPVWLDTQKVITDSSSESGKVTVGGKTLGGEVGGNQTSQMQRTSEASSGTVEKKSRSLMKYAFEQKGAQLYSDASVWWFYSALSVADDAYHKSKPVEGFVTTIPLNRTEITESLLSVLPGGPQDTTWQAPETARNELRNREWAKILENELTNLPEFIFVTGDFRISTSPTLLLVHDFDGPDYKLGINREKFEPVQFYVTFPPNTTGPDLTSGLQKLTVFGKVVHGLDRNGTVAVRAIAVY